VSFDVAAHRTKSGLGPGQSNDVGPIPKGATLKLQKGPGLMERGQYPSPKEAANSGGLSLALFSTDEDGEDYRDDDRPYDHFGWKWPVQVGSHGEHRPHARIMPRQK
jgi:hypothetical protein